MKNPVPEPDPTPDNPLAEACQRLAQLSLEEYERVRKAEAKALVVRTSVLDTMVASLRPAPAAADEASLDGGPVKFVDPEPWPESVNGAALLESIADVLSRHCILPPGAAYVMAAWTVFTYCAGRFRFAPIVFLLSPEEECGKSRVREVLQMLVWRPFASVNASTPALFRVVHRHAPTVLLDEFDNANVDDRADLIALLNTGYEGGPNTLGFVRLVGDDFVPRCFRVYGPKLLASVKNPLPRTTFSRCIVVPMRRRRPSEAIQPIRDVEYSNVKRACVRWVADATEALEATRLPALDFLSDRQNDALLPLRVIAHAAGGDAAGLLEAALATLLREADGAARDSSDIGTMLLEDLRDILTVPGCAQLPTNDILGKLWAMDERPWATYTRGRPLDARKLSGILRHYDVSPATIRVGGATPKGYRRDDFSDAWGRYLDTPPEGGDEGSSRNTATPDNPPPEAPETPKSSPHSGDPGFPTRNTATPIDSVGGNPLFASATLPQCCGNENTTSPNDTKGCCGVASGKPGVPIAGENCGDEPRDENATSANDTKGCCGVAAKVGKFASSAVTEKCLEGVITRALGGEWKGIGALRVAVAAAGLSVSSIALKLAADRLVTGGVAVKGQRNGWPTYRLRVPPPSPDPELLPSGGA